MRFWREAAGTSALAGYGLPTDAALAANANVNARAKEYKKARVDGTMDQLRVQAFLDILNGIAAHARITQARAGQAGTEGGAQAQPDSQSATGQDVDGAGAGQDTRGAAGQPGGDRSPGTGNNPAGSVSDELDAHPADDRPDDGNSPAQGNSPGPADGTSSRNDEPTHGGSSGEGIGFGDGVTGDDSSADDDADANRSHHGTGREGPGGHDGDTGPDGTAIGHGCARPARPRHARGNRGTAPPPRDPTGPWALTPRDTPGPPGGYGSWTLTLPGGRDLTVDILRHLVQVRDGKCTFPCCSRHARESDFEHATPTTRAAGRACATPGRAPADATKSNNPGGGVSRSRSPVGISGPPQADAPMSRDR